MPQQEVESLPVAPSTLIVLPLVKPEQQARLDTSQKSPPTQLVASLHVVKQALAPQMKGVQSVVPCGWQVPAPSQVVGSVWVLPEQLPGAPHAVRLFGNVQAPRLSQSLAPHDGSVVSHRVVQQWPVPVMPQMPEVQASLVAQGPVATRGTQWFAVQ
jgi:hypothetical protein